MIPHPPMQLPSSAAAAQPEFGAWMRAGIGLKMGHRAQLMAAPSAVGFVEIHAENYMGQGGPMHAWLTRIREDLPLSIHGVGLSIGGTSPLNQAHLARLQRLVARYEPFLFSEHLAWSSHGGDYLGDLLPLPYTGDTLVHVCTHVQQVQERLGRQMLLENPATYLEFECSTWSEPDFLAEIVARTGCGLLLDLNNVHVTCNNHGLEALGYLSRIPMRAVAQVHLAGHSREAAEDGSLLLIDDHGAAVDEAVWSLYRDVVTRIGPVPSLVEWDTNVPALEVLVAQARAADALAERAVADQAMRFRPARDAA